jgi:uncharacterized repeat protein (TIGR03803 family)
MGTLTQQQGWVFGIRGRAAGATLTLAIVLILAVLATGSAQAQSYGYSVLHQFTGSPGGEYPYSPLVMDTQGNLYGATYNGGNSATQCYPNPGCGVVFKLDTSGNETLLHTFTNTPDGAYPFGALVLDAQSNLYGATLSGGAYDWGTVFKIDPSGNETVLYSFCIEALKGYPCTDGANPNGGLVRDAQGNLCGTTEQGGASGYGTVFRLSANAKETVLHSFAGAGGDGADPLAGLARDPQGNLYGTT